MRGEARARTTLARAGGAVAWTLLAASGLVLLAGCKKQPGDACKQGESACVDATSALACVGGKLEAVPCRGAAGCSMLEGKAHCDVSVASVDEPCAPDNEDDLACSPDGKRALVCKGGKIALHLECRGPSGCALVDQQLSCDTSVAARGDRCRTAGAAACGEGGKELVVCREGTFRVQRICRGARGCYRKDEAPACDDSLALDGDPCVMPGFVACSVDGKSELICQGSSFMKTRACKGGCKPPSRPGGAVDCP